MPANSGTTAAANDAVHSANTALQNLDNVLAGGGSVPRAEQKAPVSSLTDSGKNNPPAPAVTVPAAKSTPGKKPAWVDNPESVYSKDKYVVAVGFSMDRKIAEGDALGKLTGVFNQSIQANLKLQDSASETVKNGVSSSAQQSSIQNDITLSSSLDNLMGAEIADVWVEPKTNVTYAVAVMEKARGAVLYGDLVKSNLRVIDDLVRLSDADKNSLDGYSRYLQAAKNSDENQKYINVLNFVGNTTGFNLSTLKRGADYRLAASDIAKSIPVGIVVSNDKSDRIKGAFAKVIAGAGFRTGDAKSRYVLNVAFILSPVESPNPNKFARYEIDASLTDTLTNTVLVPYTTNGREGHLNLSEAENRAVAAAEKKISTDYQKKFSDYLTNLLPK
jgi:hypothetical protein